MRPVALCITTRARWAWHATWALLLTACLLDFAQPARGQTAPMGATPPGYIEAGVPPFVVLGPEALGLSAAPIDLQQMPDGRLLAFGHGEYAVGDGVRWEVFHQAPKDAHVNTTSVAVDASGEIYAGMGSGFGRVEFGPDGLWHFRRVEELPVDLKGTPDVNTSAWMIGNQWFWSSGSGPIVQWHPGERARTVGEINAAERVFTLGSDVYMTDQSDGTLLRFQDGQFRPIPVPRKAYLDQTITCSVALGDGSSLVGTISNGLLQARGIEFRPWISKGILSGSHRINDVCAIGSGLVAVAVDNFGVVIVGGSGKIIQSLDRSVDSRLSRVKRLVHASSGVVWALLNEGIVRIGFPTRFTYFESMLSTGLTYSQPFRHAGALWLTTDGQVQHGVYDSENRLTGFEVDTPPEHVHSLVELDGDLVASTRDGIFSHRPEGGWTLQAKGPASAYVSPKPLEPGRWLYIAENEYGWLRRTEGGYSFERFADPSIGHPYGVVTDAAGIFWAELGTAKVARIDPSGQRPRILVLGRSAGLPDSWAQICLIGGEVRVTTHDLIRHYDPSNHRFITDTGLVDRFPALVGSIGRPANDARGRLWITRSDDVVVIDPTAANAAGSEETVPAGLRPLYFTPQDDGVVWMSAPNRLARFDPSVPAAATGVLGAVITRVELPSSGHVLFPSADRIADVPESDASLIIHYLAPNQPYGQPVTFDVQLSGGNGGWIPEGSAGAVSFNRLEPGIYRLLVRPHLGGLVGKEASLEFAVLAPWYRTRTAFALFGAGGLAAVVFAIWLTAYLQRREKTRLERLVAIRTAELHATNKELEQQIKETTEKTAALKTSEERFRRLNDNAPDIIFRVRLVPDIGYDYISPSVTAITGYPQEAFLSDPSFPSKIAASADAASIYDHARAGRVPPGISEARWKAKDGRVVVLEERLTPVLGADGKLLAIEGISRDVTQRIEEQEKRRSLESQLLQSQKLESVGTLAGGIAHDFNNILTGILGYCELATLTGENNPESLGYLREIRLAGLRAKDLVTRILTFSRRTESKLAPVNLGLVVREALSLVRASTPATINIQTELEDGTVLADSTQIHQIVVNLCTNGIQAMSDGRGTLRIGVKRLPPDSGRAAEIRNYPRGACVRLSVSDTGRGMDQATMTRIFDPFFTTKASEKGTGLGLSIVQGITANHDAALKVSSEPGKGTTVELFFPESALSPSSSTTDAQPPRGAHQSILVVDDEHTITAFLEAGLRKLGFEVTAFNDPREAYKAFEARPDRFHAVVTDLTMPDLTGVELIQKIRSTGSRIPAILASGYNTTASSLPPEVALHTTLVSKPFEALDLARILGQMLKESAPAK